LFEERRGKNSTVRRPTGELSIEEKLKRAEAKIKLLEAENDLLKKLEALERKKRNDLSSSERFQLIYHTIQLHSLKRMTLYLCQLAEVRKAVIIDGYGLKNTANIEEIQMNETSC